MNHSMRRGLWIPAALTLTAGLTSGFSLRAEAQGRELALFRGDSGEVSGITPGNWGSGTVTEDKQVLFAGTQSFKIVSHGMAQGAKLAFSKPVNIGSFVGNKDSLLQFTALIQDSRNTAAGGFGAGRGNPFGGMMGGASGMPSGMAGGFAAMMRGRGGAGGPGGIGGGGQQQQQTVQKAKPAENLRVALVTSGGKTLEFLLPIEYARDEGQGTWKSLSIPLAAIPGLQADDAEIKEVRVFADQYISMHLGQIRVFADPTPITVDRISDKLAIPRNATATYTCRAVAGNVPLKVSWDFDERDGIQEDKVGKTVRFAYPKSGEYVATATVSDPYGIRPPVVRKFKVYISQ